MALCIVVPITGAEAILGGEVTVPLMKGPATLKVPPGVRSGAKLRLKGKGVVDAKKQAGDLYAVLEIVAPKADDLSEDDRAALGLGARMVERQAFLPRFREARSRPNRLSELSAQQPGRRFRAEDLLHRPEPQVLLVDE